MWEATFALPETLPEAVETGRRVEGSVGSPAVRSRRGDYAHALVIGAGGGEQVAAALATISTATVPVLCNTTSDLPGFVGDTSLVLALSGDGVGSRDHRGEARREPADERTGVQLADAALRAGATVVAVAPEGSSLSRWAGAQGVPLLGAPAVGGDPGAHDAAQRVPFGPLLVTAVAVTGSLGLHAGVDRMLEGALAQVRTRRDQLRSDPEPALGLARAIGRTMPLVHGSTGISAVAARHWKAQVNRNAKAPAWASADPGLLHDELAGWGQHGDVTRQLLTVVSLHRRSEPPEVARRIGAVDALLREVVAEVLEIHAAGEGDLAELLDLVFLGDVVSLAMASREGVDPGPLSSVEELEVQGGL